ncbi:MAG: hypothetical protein WAM39_28130, partial [Bryobacteraceae bacterium]
MKLELYTVRWPDRPPGRALPTDSTMLTNTFPNQTVASRREWFRVWGTAASALVPSAVFGQTERDWTGKTPIHYPDPDVIAVEKQFTKYRITSAAIERVYTGLR